MDRSFRNGVAGKRDWSEILGCMERIMTSKPPL